MNVKDVYSEWYETICDEEIDSVSVLKEMIDVRDGRGKCDIFHMVEVQYIINDICVN